MIAKLGFDKDMSSRFKDTIDPNGIMNPKKILRFDCALGGVVAFLEN